VAIFSCVIEAKIFEAINGDRGSSVASVARFAGSEDFRYAIPGLTPGAIIFRRSAAIFRRSAAR
jgi:hypothetical protein